MLKMGQEALLVRLTKNILCSDLHNEEMNFRKLEGILIFDCREMFDRERIRKVGVKDGVS